MSMFRKAAEPMPVMPQEVNVPVPHIPEHNEVTAWAPRRNHNLANDEAQDSIERAVGHLNSFKEQIASLREQLQTALVQLEIQKGRNADLELTNAQLRNDLAVSRTTETDAKREASDWLSLWQNVAAMISSFEIGAQAPSAARRKAKERKNGEVAVMQPTAETPTSEAPKAEAPDGQA